MRSNIESPMNIPEILDLLAPIALEIITPRAHAGRERDTRREDMRHEVSSLTSKMTLHGIDTTAK
jgi:hypothetical protein